MRNKDKLVIPSWMWVMFLIGVVGIGINAFQKRKGPKIYPPNAVRGHIISDCSHEVKETYIGQNSPENYGNPEKARQEIIAYAQNPIEQTDKWQREIDERIETPEFSNCKAKKSDEWLKQHPQEATYEDGTK
jgi:hypothetical protein